MTNDDAVDNYRLPYDVAPRRYELALVPDLDAATFSGSVKIEIEVLVATSRIVMNASELEVRDATLSDQDQRAGTVRLGVELDQAVERVSFISDKEIVPGYYELSCEFTGILNDRLCGFYRSTFKDERGNERVIATTQFEQTDARLAFPCFDEPDRKASFAISIDVPPGMLAVSNGKEISSTPVDSGRTRVQFSETISMSSYLVAFVVGPLEATDPIDVDGVQLRVVHTPGKSHLTAPALECGAHALRFYSDYTGIRYPGDKLDLVGLPDFAAGAMENLGCVTFRETALLADPNDTSRTEMQRVAEVIEHEIAHMWFGDLVTMRWWNGIWLNEAFATFMSLRCQDDYRPEWDCFTGFSRDKASALTIDALHATRPIEIAVRSPEEAGAMFDVLTYEKGTGVLWMIEEYIGRDKFREGVRDYLIAHEYGNTETGDLWDALERAAGDEPVRAIMDSWIFQGGYPLIEVGARQGSVRLEQHPFSLLTEPPLGAEGSSIGADWLVPTLYGAPGSNETSRVLLRADPLSVEPWSGPIVVNKRGAGFYRVHYDERLLNELVARFSELTPLERFGVAADTWAVVLGGSADSSEIFRIASHLVDETDPYVWSVVIGALSAIDHVASDGERDAVAAATRRLLSPVFDRISFDSSPSDDEQTPILRSALITALGTFGNDEEVVSRCFKLFACDVDGTAALAADIASAVVSVVAEHASRADFETILERYRNPTSPLDGSRSLNAHTSLSDPSFAREVHELTRTEIRSQNAPYLLSAMLRSRAIGSSTWEFVSKNYDELVGRFPANSIHRMLEGIAGLSELDGEGEPIYLEQVRAFCQSHTAKGQSRLVSQSIERLEVNVRLAQSLNGRIDAVTAIW